MQERTLEFNQLFVLANSELSKGNLVGLEEGVRIFSEALQYAGRYRVLLSEALSHLKKAYELYSRADRKGPWNRVLSGYGLHSWSSDLAKRDEELNKALQAVEKINSELLAMGLGFRPNRHR